jgi:hypothetical protein
MTAGLAVQQAIHRCENVPIALWTGLGVTAAWMTATIVIGAFRTARRVA